MNPTVPPRVVCVGAITLDAIARDPRYPDRDERILATEITFAGGGPAATAAVVLARQGVPVAVVGRVGADSAGEQALKGLDAEGVDCSGVQISPEHPTQTSCIVVAEDTATRAISTLQVPPLTRLSERALELIAQAEWVHADQLGFAPYVAASAGLEADPKLSVDAGNPVPGLMLAGVELFVPTAEALRRITGEDDLDRAARAALSQGARSVVATDGSRGSWAWWPDAEAGEPRTVQAPAADGVRIASTLGAGDVFHGGLLAALCRGENFASALRSANATAALSCRGLDGRSAIPSATELTAFLSPDAPRVGQ